MRLSKEDYREAKRCLKRYNYNCINILNIKFDIMSLSSSEIDGMPKNKYSVSDKVLNSVIQIQENVELQKSIKEYKAVIQALELVNSDSKYIFEEFYKKGKSKWDIISNGMSERTFVRKNSELIYAVHTELKKLA